MKWLDWILSRYLRRADQLVSFFAANYERPRADWERKEDQ